jgi:Tripartite tricarboxylate transporter family receptor
MGRGDPRGQHQGGMKRRFTRHFDVMKLPRRQFLHLTAGAAALPAISRIACAQAYPARPVRIIVGFPAGGGSDIIARLLGQWMTERLGQSFIIENRPGAGTNIAIEAVVRARADGYTLLLLTSSGAINATLTTSSITISSGTSCRWRASAVRPSSGWSTHHFQPRLFLSSLPMRGSGQTRSTWGQQGMEHRNICPGRYLC